MRCSTTWHSTSIFTQRFGRLLSGCNPSQSGQQHGFCASIGWQNNAIPPLLLLHGPRPPNGLTPSVNIAEGATSIIGSPSPFVIGMAQAGNNYSWHALVTNAVLWL
jgi:hypothetical protein